MTINTDFITPLLIAPTQTPFKFSTNLESVAIANALQLEAARRHASLFPL